MTESDRRRYAHVNLPHGRTVVQRIARGLECLGLPEEGAALALQCGERPDSPLR